MAKFSLGDKVRLTPRATTFATQDLRRRTRTIVAVMYDDSHLCAYYQLGSQGKGELGYWFRSYMLAPARQLRRIGRPCLKRKYNSGTKLLLDCHNDNLGSSSSNEYPRPQGTAKGLNFGNQAQNDIIVRGEII